MYSLYSLLVSHASQTFSVDLQYFVSFFESSIIESGSSIEDALDVKSHRTASRITTAHDGKAKTATRRLRGRERNKADHHKSRTRDTTIHYAKKK